MKQPTKAEIEAMRAIASYLQGDEKKHWQEMNRPKNHIYQSVRLIEKYLKRIT